MVKKGLQKRLDPTLFDVEKANCFVQNAPYHETVISHIRRGLEHRFPRSTPGETRARFATRMSKVQEYINSSDFRAKDGGGLDALAKSLRERCRRVSLLKGEHLRT